MNILKGKKLSLNLIKLVSILLLIASSTTIFFQWLPFYYLAFVYFWRSLYHMYLSLEKWTGLAYIHIYYITKYFMILYPITKYCTYCNIWYYIVIWYDIVLYDKVSYLITIWFCIIWYNKIWNKLYHIIYYKII